ncbi:hypothetical protein MHH70_18105 [Metasolibacillus sp. FSL H7-0170]|uniref:hypothetical protein n=1 Tax=Metasolibacillus TaxID=2703677 RepID=UPI00079B7BB1|nr:hypothetical protein [Metasolibacillus fluoroglycofenilyticus]KYG91458.1 hypothetical protein A0U40_00460 [[Bacillus] sp. KCTC 13219]
MNRKWLHGLAITTLAFTLTGCGKSVQEQIEVGVASAETIFQESAEAPNTTIGSIELFVPKSYTVEQGANEMNYILTKDKDSYILFVNTNEQEDSKLHYDNLIADETKNIVKSQEIETTNEFGFSAVVQLDDKQYELIVSSGGIKMTTLSEDRKIEEKLHTMMQIVRSVQITK